MVSLMEEGSGTTRTCGTFVPTFPVPVAGQAGHTPLRGCPRCPVGIDCSGEPKDALPIALSCEETHGLDRRVERAPERLALPFGELVWRLVRVCLLG